MRAAVETAAGVAIVDLEDEAVIDFEPGETLEPPHVDTGLPLVVTADQSGSLVIAVVARRPPLVISRDAGSTWHEAGHGLPPGRAVAISPDHPDLILFAGECRVYQSRDGGRFWHPLGVELQDIHALGWPAEAYLG